MIELRTGTEIDAMAEAGSILARLFEALGERVQPGTSTQELDRFAEDFIRDHHGATPAFKGLYGFPATLCTSINQEVVHGIPSPQRILEEGDIVSIDAGAELDGWFADMAVTFAVADIDPETARLLQVTHTALEKGVDQARPGNRLGDIGHAIQSTAETAGFAVVRDLVGHGVGRKPHEDPQVPNFGRPGRGLRIEPGLVLAIEPMFNAGDETTRTLADRWTVVTTDDSPSAHFEHTVAVTANGPRVLTRPAT